LLTGKRYRGNGIAYLVLGANAHLSIVQEMANMDPDCADPGKSTYTDTYYQLLSSYAEVLQAAINDVNTKRQTYLGNVCKILRKTDTCSCSKRTPIPEESGH
jgi:hypothetical protein